MITKEIPSEALVTNWSAIPSEQIADGIKRQMVVGKNVMVCRFTFDPLVVTDVHSHPHEQITLVTRGKVQFSVDGKSMIANAGDVLYFPSNLRHGATMLEEQVILIDIFSPIREDFLNGSSSYRADYSKK
jgi:quercetin dioxygenase-like cupin family protein